MSSDSDEQDVQRTQPPAERRPHRRSPLYADMMNSPAMQLQRSLAAQQDLLKAVPSIPDFSAALRPPSTAVFRDIQNAIAVQRSIRSELADTALALRTAQNRILAEFQAVATVSDAVSKAFRQAAEAASMFRQVVSGSVLSEIRSVLAVRESFASEIRSQLQAVTEARNLVTNDVVSSIRAATAVQGRISQQLQETLRASSAFRTQAVPVFQAVASRLSTLRLDELEQMAEKLEAHDTLFTAWSVAGSATLVVQLEADLAAHPDADTWGIEDKINYLIEWTQRQDNAEFSQIMIALLVNLVAAAIFWLSVEVVPALMSDADGFPPKTVVQQVRERLREQPLPIEDVSQLRIISRRWAPVRDSHHRSLRVARLRAGTLVRACQKRGKWVFVEWTDFESGQSRDGWMLSKCLSPVEKRFGR